VKSIAEKIERHRAFWTLEDVSKPLVGLVVGGWSAYRENPAWGGLQDRDGLVAGEVHPEDFVPWIEEHLAELDELDDDAVRAAQPFQAIPWLEAVVGCRLRSSSEHIWAEPFLDRASARWLGGLELTGNPWARKYAEFLDVLGEHFGDRRPLAQAILRGPSDLACACLGEEQLVLSLVDEREASASLLEGLTDVWVAFLEMQWQHIPRFHGGQVIGEYDLWAPQKAFRLQEDASALLSPDLYRELVLPFDEKLCAVTPYNVMHVHTSSFHLLDSMLMIENLGAVQISQDEGVPLSQSMPYLSKTQDAGKPLIVKGQFTEADLMTLRDRLSPKGLCIQAVVGDLEGARHLLRLAG